MNGLFNTALTITAGIVLACITPHAAAQYPVKTVRIIVPFPAGGGVDIVARAVAERLAPRLGQPIIVDNRPGAGTSIGTDAVAKSLGDGYTLLIGPISSYAILKSTRKSLPFDMTRDLAPVSRIGYGTIVLVVPPTLGVNSVKELAAAARAKPGRLTFASSGTGAIIHLTSELFKQAAGIDIAHVPFKGTTQILPDLLDGRIDMALDSLPAYLPHIRAGKLRPLAVASRNRSALLPEVPTMAEAGFPAVVAAVDYALYAPATTPREIITLLNREMNALIQTSDLRSKLASAGIELAGGTPDSLATELAEDIIKWAKIVREAGVQPE